MEKESTEARVVAFLKAAGLTLFTAESCTGGLVAKRVTDVPGASAVLLGGVVSYTNAVKTGLLGVSPATIGKYTEVSPECAAEMAEGARRISHADIGVSATGYASAGTGVKPEDVGLIFIGISTCRGTETKTLRLTGDRRENREDTAEAIFEMILQERQYYESTAL